MPNINSINKEGLELIKSFEGIEDGDPTTVNLDPYWCPADVATIGWGHSIFYNGKQLTKKTDPDMVIAKSLYPNGITMDEAEQLLLDDVRIFERQVRRAVKVNLNSNQFSALVSFTFNVGVGNLGISTLLRKLNAGDFLGAADEFPKWRKSNGVVLNGLVRRRAAERDLFLKK